MTHDDIFLNINDYNFDSLLCQAAIKTEVDVNNYQAEGYYTVYWTSEAFSKIWSRPRKSILHKILGCELSLFQPRYLSGCTTKFRVHAIRERRRPKIHPQYAQRNPK